MSTRMGLLGKKIGMMQAFDSSGASLPLVVIEVGPCTVLDVKHSDVHGYSSIQLGYGDQKAHRTTRPKAGLFAKAQCSPKRFIREIRLDGDELLKQFSRGQTLSVGEVFKDGDVVDVRGTSTGKGFQGVMKRHNFGGFRATHGTHEYFRHGGSIGCRLTPGRVYRGRKMPGQMGNKRVTVQNIGVYEVIPDKNIILVRGAVPGPIGSSLIIRHAVKKLPVPFELISPIAAESADNASVQSANA